jgi:hypothetical protein
MQIESRFTRDLNLETSPEKQEHSPRSQASKDTNITQKLSLIDSIQAIVGRSLGITKIRFERIYDVISTANLLSSFIKTEALFYEKQNHRGLLFWAVY